MAPFSRKKHRLLQGCGKHKTSNYTLSFHMLEKFWQSHTLAKLWGRRVMDRFHDRRAAGDPSRSPEIGYPSGRLLLHLPFYTPLWYQFLLHDFTSLASLSTIFMLFMLALFCSYLQQWEKVILLFYEDTSMDGHREGTSERSFMEGHGRTSSSAPISG